MDSVETAALGGSSATGPTFASQPADEWKWSYNVLFGIMYGPIPVGWFILVGLLVLYLIARFVLGV